MNEESKKCEYFKELNYRKVVHNDHVIAFYIWYKIRDIIYYAILSVIVVMLFYALIILFY